MAVNFGVNYIAVVVAAVVALVIGFIWYSRPVFGNRWMAYLGTTQAQLGNPGPSGRRGRRLTPERVGSCRAVAESRRKVANRRDHARRSRVARVHGDDHGGADLVREETLGGYGS